MIEYSIHTLPNGLRIVHNYDPSTCHVVLDTLYNVGARDESPELTGMAHLFEHLMFGGSVNVPDFDGAVETAGGTDNAWTSNDFTNFYTVVPAANVETAFWVESDRMLSLAFTPESLEVQRKVVMEEFKQTCLNRPYGDMAHRLRRLLYTTHPYRWPTIGKELAHIDKVTLRDVRDFFFSHYAPNNAVLAVSGPVDESRVLQLAEKWYGDIPRRDIAPRINLPEPPITDARRETVECDVPQTRITIAMLMDAADDPDYRVADLITDILASGQSARFNRDLVLGSDIFTAADAGISGSEEQGFIRFAGALRSNDPASLEKAERMIWRQLDHLRSEDVAEHELQRALNRFESNRTFSQINYLNRASQLARSVMTGRDINSETALYRQITPADIHRVASRLFRPSCSATLIYRPRSL